MDNKHQDTQGSILFLLKGIFLILILPFVGIKLMERESWFSRIVGALAFAFGVWVWLAIVLG